MSTSFIINGPGLGEYQEFVHSSDPITNKKLKYFFPVFTLDQCIERRKQIQEIRECLGY